MRGPLKNTIVGKGAFEMEKILDVAQYIITKYQEVSKEKIDEMKLHKLLYLAQRENLAITNEPLFKESMHGWRYGPVSPEVRAYFTDSGIVIHTKEVSDESAYVLNNVIFQYGQIASWKLSEMTHKEISWKNARVGLAEEENGNRPLKLDDIREDAKKVRPYDHVWDMYYDEFDDLKEGAV